MSGAMSAVAISSLAVSTMGSYYGAQSQRGTLAHQAQMDMINAQSMAIQLHGEADLDMINATADRNAAYASAEFGQFQAKHEAYQLRTQAAISDLKARSSASALEVGAAMDELDALLADLKAEASMRTGGYQEQDARMQYAVAKSKATASMAARGLDLSQGAPLAVRAGNDLMAENTAIRIQQDTLLAAFGHRAQATQERTSAVGRRMQAAGILSTAALSRGLAEGDATFLERQGAADAIAQRALADVGLMSAQATADYKHTMADVMKDNAMAAASYKLAGANAISPFLAGATTFMSGLGPTVSSVYQFNKVTKRSS